MWLPDFADCSALTEWLSEKDAAVFCVGAYPGAVADAELRKVTGEVSGFHRRKMGEGGYAFGLLAVFAVTAVILRRVVSRLWR